MASRMATVQTASSKGRMRAKFTLRLEATHNVLPALKEAAQHAFGKRIEIEAVEMFVKAVEEVAKIIFTGVVSSLIAAALWEYRQRLWGCIKDFWKRLTPSTRRNLRHVSVVWRDSKGQPRAAIYIPARWGAEPKASERLDELLTALNSFRNAHQLEAFWSSKKRGWVVRTFHPQSEHRYWLVRRGAIKPMSTDGGASLFLAFWGWLDKNELKRHLALKRFFGLWRGREDMQDSQAWVRKVRESWVRFGHKELRTLTS